jgi:hypothetical protein
MPDLITKLTTTKIETMVSLTAGLYKSSDPDEAYNVGILQYTVNQTVQWFKNDCVYPLDFPSNDFTIEVYDIGCVTQYTAVITYQPTMVTYSSIGGTQSYTINDTICGNFISYTDITDDITIAGGVIGSISILAGATISGTLNVIGQINGVSTFAGLTISGTFNNGAASNTCIMATFEFSGTNTITGAINNYGKIINIGIINLNGYISLTNGGTVAILINTYSGTININNDGNANYNIIINKGAINFTANTVEPLFYYL